MMNGSNRAPNLPVRVAYCLEEYKIAKQATARIVTIGKSNKRSPSSDGSTTSTSDSSLDNNRRSFASSETDRSIWDTTMQVPVDDLIETKISQQKDPGVLFGTDNDLYGFSSKRSGGTLTSFHREERSWPMIVETPKSAPSIGGQKPRGAIPDGQCFSTRRGRPSAADFVNQAEKNYIRNKSHPNASRVRRDASRNSNRDHDGSHHRPPICDGSKVSSSKSQQPMQDYHQTNLHYARKRNRNNITHQFNRHEEMSLDYIEPLRANFSSEISSVDVGRGVPRPNNDNTTNSHSYTEHVDRSKQQDSQPRNLYGFDTPSPQCRNTDRNDYARHPARFDSYQWRAGAASAGMGALPYTSLRNDSKYNYTSRRAASTNDLLKGYEKTQPSLSVAPAAPDFCPKASPATPRRTGLLWRTVPDLTKIPWKRLRRTT